MKAIHFAACAGLATLATIATLAPPVSARAEEESRKPATGGDLVRACIASSTDGQTLRKQGKLLAAREEMITCARDACPSIVRSHCARWLAEVDAAIPSVVVRAEDATGADMIGAKLAIDGRAVKLDGQAVRLDPGPHTVAIESDRGAHKEERVLLAEGEASRVVTIRFAAPGSVLRGPAASPESAARRGRHVPTGAWILGGAGVLLLGGATYFGLSASSDLNQLKGSCSPHCTEASTQPGRTDALFFDLTLGVGAAALAGAIVWALAFPSHSVATATGWSPRLEIRPVAGGGVVGLTASY
jgi:hypothetical protein